MIPTDWILGLIGGLMIGTAAAMFLLLSGRIMGASGILSGVLMPAGSARWENAAFVLGVIAVPAVLMQGAQMPGAHLTQNILVLIAAGLCVGFGTRLANGCTSGHGVCGISRFSVRGLVATLTYLGAGFVAMAVLRHGLGVI